MKKRSAGSFAAPTVTVHIVIYKRCVIAVYRAGCVEQRCQQIFFDVANIGGVLFKQSKTYSMWEALILSTSP
jgi:hypothetical protein